jgi:hypothetical protein
MRVDVELKRLHCALLILTCETGRAGKRKDHVEFYGRDRRRLRSNGTWYERRKDEADEQCLS